jgi:hypothetical protein
MRTSALWIGVVAIGAGCTTDPKPTAQPAGRLDLRQAIGVADASPIGVAVTPDGVRYVMDETRGLYQIEGESAVAVMPMSALPTPDVPIKLPITDLVAISRGVFALTAIGDGYILDTAAQTLTQKFCYLPDGTPSYLTQRTDAIAYDADRDQLYAQPLTFDPEGVLQYSQLAGYMRTTGTAVVWYGVDNSVAAGGMAIIPDTGLVLGQDAHLDRFDPDTSKTVPWDDLARYGVESIQGLAIDRSTGSLLVVDGASDELVEIALSDLGR